MSFLPWRIPSSRTSCLLLTLGALSTACGGTTQTTGDDPQLPDGSGGTGSGGTGGGGTGGAGSVVSTDAGFTAFSTTGSGTGPGSGGFGTTGSVGFGGFSTTGAIGGSGGTSSCNTNEHRLEACYVVEASAPGDAGAGGEGPAPEIDACWGMQAPSNCEASLEGQVLRVGEAPVGEACDAPLFDEPADSSELRRQYIEIDTGALTVNVALAVAGDLGVQLGDTVEVRLARASYHDEFMRGARLILKRNGQLLAIANNNLPIDAPTRVSDLTLSRGPETCRGGEDIFTCRYVAHALNVERGDELVTVTPNSGTQLGPYEIVTEDNLLVESGGGCDTGDTSDFVIARVQP